MQALKACGCFSSGMRDNFRVGAITAVRGAIIYVVKPKSCTLPPTSWASLARGGAGRNMRNHKKKSAGVVV